MIRILVVDDSAVIREGLRSLLSSQPDFLLVGEAADGLEAVASVRDLADELVIGDTGSTDGTVAIAREFGARIISVPWRDDFAAARNAVLGEARGDWILQLDADEIIDGDNARRMRALVDGDGEGHDGYWVTLANYADEPGSWRWLAVATGDPFASGYSGYIASELVRLFRNGLGSGCAAPLLSMVRQRRAPCRSSRPGESPTVLR